MAPSPGTLRATGLSEASGLICINAKRHIQEDGCRSNLRGKNPSKLRECSQTAMPVSAFKLVLNSAYASDDMSDTSEVSCTDGLIARNSHFSRVSW